VPLKFFADDMVGKLARWLRLSGFDCAYEKTIDDATLDRIAREEGRIVLTRDTRLAGRFPGLRVYRLESEDPVEQLRQVSAAFSLDLRAGLFTRCLECNCVIEPVSKESAKGRVPDFVFQTQSEFHACPGCGRIFWAGSHHDRMRERLEAWLRQWEKGLQGL